ncbi:hypothetical protein [Leuconostoc mesenteroides]|uniref:hypothetical protein n=1 Tax=Leuconostoc mesenteroides TaxID=1245 RepID=UPI00385C8F19
MEYNKYHQLHSFFNTNVFIMTPFEMQFDRYIKIGWDEDMALLVITSNFMRTYFEERGLTNKQYHQLFNSHHEDPSFNYDHCSEVNKLDYFYSVN